MNAPPPPSSFPKGEKTPPGFPPATSTDVVIESIPPMLNPVPSIRVEGTTEGTHVVSVAPGTRIESIVPAHPMLMAVRLSPYLLVLAVIMAWGSIGKIDPRTAVALATGFIVAALSTRSTSGESAFGTLAKRILRRK